VRGTAIDRTTAFPDGSTARSEDKGGLRIDKERFIKTTAKENSTGGVKVCRGWGSVLRKLGGFTQSC